MRTYEAVFILDEKRLDVTPEKFAERISSRIETYGGKVHSQESLGRKQFARPIQNQQAGTYMDFILSMEPSEIEKFKEDYRLTEAVLRLKVFHYEGKTAASTAESPSEAGAEKALSE